MCTQLSIMTAKAAAASACSAQEVFSSRTQELNINHMYLCHLVQHPAFFLSCGILPQLWHNA